MFEIDSFYLIVLSVATFILILVLGFMGWMLSHQNDEIKFPQVTISCPDFWAIDANNKCVAPASGKFNSGAANSLAKYKAIGSTTTTNVPGANNNNNPTAFDSSDDGWGTGSSATCNKRKWAIDNSIIWDSVTNVNFC